MQSGLALLTAIAAIFLSVGLNYLQSQQNEELRTDLTALREQVEGADAEVKALTAMLDTERSNENLTTEGGPTSELFGLGSQPLLAAF